MTQRFTNIFYWAFHNFQVLRMYPTVIPISYNKFQGVPIKEVWKKFSENKNLIFKNENNFFLKYFKYVLKSIEGLKFGR